MVSAGVRRNAPFVQPVVRDMRLRDRDLIEAAPRRPQAHASSKPNDEPPAGAKADRRDDIGRRPNLVQPVRRSKTVDAAAAYVDPVEHLALDRPDDALADQILRIKTRLTKRRSSRVPMSRTGPDLTCRTV